MNNSIETITKIITLATVTCYLAGVLTINGYLFSLGTSAFPSLNPRFIYTGTIVSLFLLFNILSAEILHSILINKISYAYLLVVILLSGILFYLVVPILNFSEFGDNNFLSSLNSIWSDVEIGYGILWTCLLSLISSLVLWTTWFLFKENANDFLKYFFVFLSPIILIYYFSAFGYHFYPLLPEQFGGGKPRQVIVTLKDKDSQNTDFAQYKQYILFESDKDYLLCLKDETNKSINIRQINKDDIRFIEFMPPKADFIKCRK
jgi:hypothetical protein